VVGESRGLKVKKLIADSGYDTHALLLCLISLALALRLLKDNISISMIYIIKILQMTEISTFPASILDKASYMLMVCHEYVPEKRFLDTAPPFRELWVGYYTYPSPNAFS